MRFIAALALSLTPIAAQAAEPPCLTSSEFTALSSYALPSIITGTTEHCATTLPANAWLRSPFNNRDEQPKDGRFGGPKSISI